MLENGLVGRHYVEPYAGGASVALALLFEEYAEHIHINDLNPSVAAFSRVVLDDSEWLCEQVAAIEVTVNEWQHQRAVQDQPGVDDRALAFSTLFLNRTSRSGIIGGGIIGGLNQTGQWKIDARFGREDLIRRIRKIARHRSRITATQLDAADYIERVLPTIGPAFVYLDPPYYIKGSGLYQNFYSHEDHAAIAGLVDRIDEPWIVSYDAAPEIEALYDEYESIVYDLSYSAQDRYKGRERIFLKPGLTTPSVDSPANVDWRVVDQARLANRR